MPRNTPKMSSLPTIERIGSELTRIGLLTFRTSFFAGLTIFLVDVMTDRLAPSLVIAGLLDEAGHVATAIILMAAVTRRLTGTFTGTFIVAALVAVLAIDIDHVPREVFGWAGITAGAPRPYPHSLITPLITGMWALRARHSGRDLAAGLTFGLLTHLLRDAATGSGLALFWPLTKRVVEMTYAFYVGILLVALLRTWLMARHREVPPTP